MLLKKLHKTKESVKIIYIHIDYYTIMSQKCIDDESGNSEQDWEIFDILCKDVSNNC